MDLIKQLLRITSSTKAAKLRSSSITTPSVRAPTVSQTKFGSALTEFNEKPKQYIYYDDLNELVYRFLVKLREHERHSLSST